MAFRQHVDLEKVKQTVMHSCLVYDVNARLLLSIRSNKSNDENVDLELRFFGLFVTELIKAKCLKATGNTKT